jgi:hypothetical protein
MIAVIIPSGDSFKMKEKGGISPKSGVDIFRVAWQS